MKKHDILLGLLRSNYAMYNNEIERFMAYVRTKHIGRSAVCNIFDNNVFNCKKGDAIWVRQNCDFKITTIDSIKINANVGTPDPDSVTISTYDGVLCRVHLRSDSEVTVHAYTDFGCSEQFIREHFFKLPKFLKEHYSASYLAQIKKQSYY